jgi:hypothetical protein
MRENRVMTWFLQITNWHNHQRGNDFFRFVRAESREEKIRVSESNSKNLRKGKNTHFNVPQHMKQYIATVIKSAGKQKYNIPWYDFVTYAQTRQKVRFRHLHGKFDICSGWHTHNVRDLQNCVKNIQTPTMHHSSQNK